MEFRKDTLAKIATKMTSKEPAAFWKNEHYTTIDLTNSITGLLKKNIKIFGMYGKEDALYSPTQIESLQRILGEGNTEYLDDCSHNVFIDQQTVFIDKIKNWVK